MDEQNKVNAIVNIGQMKVVEKAYDDLISLPAKNVGTALSTIIDLGNTVLWPIKWINERTRIYFQSNLKKYEVELNKIPEEKITIVPTEISMPILQRFTYVSNEELSNAFVKLLTSASSIDTIGTAHPGFIYVIDRLSPDEANILKYLKEKDNFPRLDIKYYEDPTKSIFKRIVVNETGIQKLIKLENPENISLYIDNLVSLGTIALQDYFYTDLDEDFKEIQKDMQDTINKFRKDGIDDKQFDQQIRMDRKMYLVTNYGHLFLNACIE
jgi:Abortive infection alpha